MAKRKYWAGFMNNRIGTRADFYNRDIGIMAIFNKKKDAKRLYSDVREVSISCCLQIERKE
jgi:hypothetical protein